ncbi:hypothetical protein [Aquirhabdus sp.]|uniref:hypothetical protein n=1 Tax=Aquirhabdus sp. TaxID=2824160 RepID=UPI00396C9783
MDNLVEFQCLSCDATHQEKLDHLLLSKSYLFCSICPSCGQVISGETKAEQLEHYINAHFILDSDTDLQASNLPDVFKHSASRTHKRHASH